MLRQETNIEFFQQDLFVVSEADKIEMHIRSIYNATVWLCEYQIKERIRKATTHGKKFGFVLKSLK